MRNILFTGQCGNRSITFFSLMDLYNAQSHAVRYYKDYYAI